MSSRVKAYPTTTRCESSTNGEALVSPRDDAIYGKALARSSWVACGRMRRR